MKTDIKTDIWRKFEKCQDYADKKQLVSKTEKNWNFYIGNQWKGMNTNGETLPMLNFIKPVIKYMVSNVASATMTAKKGYISFTILEIEQYQKEQKSDETDIDFDDFPFK